MELDAIPATLRAGDTWKWRDSYGDYDAADGWTLTTYFRGTSTLDVTGTADGSGWVSTAAAASTGALVAGRYSWVSQVSKDGEVFTVDSGILDVLPSISAQAEGYDGRSTAEKQLAAAETALESLLTKTRASVTFGDQSYTLVDVEKLVRVRDQLRQRVDNEKAAANGTRGRRILTRFTQP